MFFQVSFLKKVEIIHLEVLVFTAPCLSEGVLPKCVHMYPFTPKDYTFLKSIMVLLKFYPLHSEETSSLSDLYFPGSLGFVQ